MTSKIDDRSRRARMAAAGFACNQAFVYALFYLEPTNTLQLGPLLVHRADLMGILLFMCLTFYAVASLEAKLRSIALSPRFALAYACLLVLGAGVPAFAGQQALVSILYESVCVGLPAALMLCAWGQVLGREPIGFSIPVACLGIASGAAICFAFSIVPVEGFYALLYFAPLGSALLLRRMSYSREVASSSDAVASTHPAEEAAGSLSAKVIVGTVAFGLATGLTEVVAASFGDSVLRASSLILLLFVVFCFAFLRMAGGGVLSSSLLGSGLLTRESRADDASGEAGEGASAASSTVRPSSVGSSGTSASQASGAAEASGFERPPLAEVYRLAVLLMMSGFLLLPVMESYGAPGEAIVQVGYLGITVVLIALFLVMAHVSSRDAALSFARGFLALFGGELAGDFLGNALSAGGFSGEAVYLLSALAGMAVLYAYLFLFTERDMVDLSAVMKEADLFEAAVARIAGDAGLSKREAEVLPLALRGRTSERIAAELFISKNTVDTHMRRIYSKCGVRSRQELIDLGERVQRELGGR